MGDRNRRIGAFLAMLVAAAVLAGGPAGGSALAADPVSPPGPAQPGVDAPEPSVGDGGGAPAPDALAPDVPAPDAPAPDAPAPDAPAPDEPPAPAEPAPDAPAPEPPAPAEPAPFDAQADLGPEYVPFGPVRIVDSRRGQGISGRLAANAPRGFAVRAPGGIPADASAVVLNATTTDAAAAGWVVLYPCGSPRPPTSSVNLRPGQAVANLVTVGLGRGSALGEVCASASTGVHLVVDLLGYHSAGSTFRAIPPERIADTRPGTSAPGPKGVVAGPGRVLRIAVAGASSVPTGAVAAAVNVTVTRPSTAGYLSLYPCDRARPLASMLNFAAGQDIANAATTGLAADGTVCIAASTTTHVVVDLSGWYEAGSALATRTPVRLADTRPGQPGGWHKGEVAVGRVFEQQVVGIAGVPNGATTALLNLTVVAPTSAGWAVVYPCQRTRPLASNINFAAGATVAASVITAIGPRGSVCVASSAPTQLVIDLVGEYRGDPRPPAPGSTFVRADGVGQMFAVEPDGTVLPVSPAQHAAAGSPAIRPYRVPTGTVLQRASWSPTVYAVEPGAGARRVALAEWIARLTPPIREVPLVPGSTVQKTANSATLYVVAPDGAEHLALSQAQYRAIGSPTPRVVTAVPGSRFVRTERLPTVYAMAPDGTTRALSAAEYASVGSPRVEVLVWSPVWRAVGAADLWASYRPGCPVGPAALVRLEVPYWDFDGRLRQGAIVVARSAGATIEATMRSAFDAHFPVQQVTPVERYRGVDEASMAAGNTSAFNCRPVVGNPTRLSQHSYGNAIDINPAQNPYVTASAVYPAGSQTYLNRGWKRPGMLYAGDPVVGRLTGAGWWWGARWSRPDYHHFSSNGG
jgi:hypothetical protein